MSETIKRDYVDNFSIRELALNEIMPKYFEEEQNNLTVGLTGMLTEYIGTVTEDAFLPVGMYCVKLIVDMEKYNCLITESLVI